MKLRITYVFVWADELHTTDTIDAKPFIAIIIDQRPITLIMYYWL